jgi:hypothetical protein
MDIPFETVSFIAKFTWNCKVLSIDYGVGGVGVVQPTDSVLLLAKPT